MIIFGTKGVTSTIKTGLFECPQCAANKGFSHKKVTRFFTLYFIPLIPLGQAGEYVECGGCKNTYVTRVLTMGKQVNIVPNFEKAIKDSMILIMLADGKIEESEKIKTLEVINCFVKTKITMFQLDNEIKRVQKEKNDISLYLKTVASTLNDEGKEQIIKCAYQIALSDGNVDSLELIQIEKMAKSLEISEIHYKALLESLKIQNN